MAALVGCAAESGNDVSESGEAAEVLGNSEYLRDIASALEVIAVDATSIEAPELHEQYLEYLPDTGKRIRVYTFINGLGEKEVVAVDEARRAQTDLEAARGAEAAALSARCGRIERALCEQMASARAPIPVVVWLIHPEADADRDLAERDNSAFTTAREAAINARRRTVERVATRIERTLGRVALTRSRFAPVLAGRLTSAEISRVAADLEVGAIMRGGDEISEDLAASLALSNWSSSPTYDGTGVSVGILEVSRPDMVTQLPPLVIRNPTGATSAHARLVAGIIANTSPTPGYANGASLYIANRVPTDTDINDLDWALTAVAGAPTRVNNQSWHFEYERTLTTLSPRDRYLDYLTRTYALFYSTASSNTDDRHVVHKGYNIVMVGATYGNGLIVDGIVPAGDLGCGLEVLMPPYVSTWRNGVPQELPHLVTDGGCITAVGTTNAGTSFAAPGVTGMAAGLGELNSSLLSWPEAVKAILVASPDRSSVQSPDGCAWRSSRPTGSSSCTVADGRDGTGLVDGARARAMAEVRSGLGTQHMSAHDYGFINTASFESTGQNFLTNEHYAEAAPSCVPQNNLRLRVVLAWDSDASCTAGSASSCTDALNMDLDLRVYEEPGGTLVGQSSTTANSYEHVDVPIRGSTSGCQPSGNPWHYRIEVRYANYSPSATRSTYYGLAWHAYRH